MLIVERLRKRTPQQLYIARRARANIKDIIATIDPAGFMQLRKGARHRSPNLNNLKYFNLDMYIYEHLRRAFWLRLEYASKTVLDIGTGFGYFPYICEYYANKAVAIDLPGHQLFDDVTEFLGVNKLHQRIEPFKPLAGLERTFDLITAFQVSFNRNADSRPWGEEEWSFLLDDMFSHVLKEGGEIAMELNYDWQQKVWLNPGARRAMKRYRAKILGASVRLKR